jgi:hypothetical protein
MGIKTKNTARKIILTTDQDLIKDGVQAIDDEFLEWFVKNPSCEEVELKKSFKANPKYNEQNQLFEKVGYWKYKIIIPKEEAKQEDIKQTAVEYLIKEFSNILGKIQTETLQDSIFLINAIEQAKEMEKQQIIEAHFQGVKETVLNLSEHIIIPKTLNTIQEIENGIGKHEEGEDYYNKKFKNK